MHSLKYAELRMLKNTSIKGVRYEIWQFECDIVQGQQWHGNGSPD
jgi:hypothetical protein